MSDTTTLRIRMHHIALRVADATVNAEWLQRVLKFQVDRQFTFAGKDFIWLCAPDSPTPVIELIGGGQDFRSDLLTGKDPMASIHHPGLNHICVETLDLEKVVTEVRRYSDVKILIDVIPGAPGSGVEKGAFIGDPWGNTFELLQMSSR